MEDLASTLLDLERELAGGGGDVYRSRLDEEALVVVPGMVLDRTATVAAMDESEGWDAADFSDVRLLRPAGDVALLVYTFTGRRGDVTYRAVLSSAYARRGDAWRMVFHQQTPLG